MKPASVISSEKQRTGAHSKKPTATTKQVSLDAAISADPRDAVAIAPSGAPSPIRFTAAATGACLFVSGMNALVCQVAWFREFRLIFGSSTQSSAAVLAIFMAGLGIGNVVFGRRADAYANPLRIYGLLELGVGAAIGAGIVLVPLVASLYIATGGQSALGPVAATGLRLILAGAVLIVPTLLMGGTLPVALRVITRSSDGNRRSVGMLYGTNTLGAVVGAALCTFLLMEQLGSHWTLLLACVASTAIGTAAILLAHRSRSTAVGGERTAAAFGRTEAPADPRRERAFPATIIYLASAAVGFVFFLMEIVWYRMLGPLLGGSTYTFGLILIVALLGIGLGGLLYPLLFRSKLRPTPLLFSISCGLEALCLAVPFAVGDRIAVFTLALREQLGSSFTGLVWGWLVVAGIVVLPAAVVAGVQFPLLVALLGKGNARVGRETGFACAWNTSGAILGSLVGGFGLLPLLTAPGVWKLAAVLLCLVGTSVLAATIGSLSAKRWIVAPTCVVLAALGCLLSTGPTAVWRHSGIGAGRADLPSRTPNEVRNWMNRTRRHVVWEAEGVESSIAIHNGNALAFFVNGKSDGNAVNDAGTQIMAGLTGALLHQEPKSAFVVGLGTGETAGWLADVPTMDRVDVVEFEPAVAEMARRCAAVNRNVLEHPRVNLVYNDAREVLLTGDRHYDLIVSEPSNPFRAGIASLYTREFFAAARSRLRPNGLFLQWLQAYEVDRQTVLTVLATLRSEFARVEVWQTRPADLLLVCYDAPTDYDVDRLRERVEQEPFRSAMKVAWRGAGVEAFLAHCVVNADDVDALLARNRAPVNTDDRNVLEYGFSRAAGRPSDFSLAQLREDAAARGNERPKLRGQAVDWLRVGEERLDFYAAMGVEIPLQSDMSPGLRARALAWQSYLQGDMRSTLAAWYAQPQRADSITAQAILAHAFAVFGDARAEAFIEPLRRAQPIEAEALLGLLRYRQRQEEDAIRHLTAGLSGLRTDPWAMPSVASAVFGLAVELAERNPQQAQAIDAALREPFALCAFDEQRRAAQFLVAQNLGEVELMESVDAFEPHPIWKKEFLAARAKVYQSAGHRLAAPAGRDLDLFLKRSR